jgi:peptide deformylase
VTAGEAVPSRWPLELVRGYVEKVLEVAAAVPDGSVPIQPAGHPSLRTRALPYDGQLDDDVLLALLDVMRRTMHAAPGVGLAAPQIGLPLALAVVADPGAGDTETAAVRERPEVPYRVLVNPAYEAVPGEEPERVAFYEGCLSVPGLQAVVPRLRRIRLTGTDETGAPLDEVLQGWPARIVQHETDHLNGTLYLDRAHLRSLSTTDHLGPRWAGEPRPLEASQTLGFPLD